MNLIAQAINNELETSFKISFQLNTSVFGFAYEVHNENLITLHLQQQNVSI